MAGLKENISDCGYFQFVLNFLAGTLGWVRIDALDAYFMDSVSSSTYWHWETIIPVLEACWGPRPHQRARASPVGADLEQELPIWGNGLLLHKMVVTENIEVVPFSVGKEDQKGKIMTIECYLVVKFVRSFGSTESRQPCDPWYCISLCIINSQAATRSHHHKNISNIQDLLHTIPI
jgi:hypothetical protein